MEPLERFFRNLILSEKNELKNRYLLVGLKPSEKARLDANRQSGQKTVDRLVSLLKANPHLTQEGMVAALMIKRSTIQKHISNLKKAGRLRRVGPDKGGHWEVIG